MTEQMEALARLKPLEGELVSCVRDAWGSYEKAGLAFMNSSARAHVVQQYMVEYGRQRLCLVPGVDFLDVQNRELFRVGQELLLRFKKLSRDGTAANYPTQGALRFRQQETLPGVPDTLRLDVGYVLNAAETEVELVMVVNPSDHSRWLHVLWDGADATSNTQLDGAEVDLNDEESVLPMKARANVTHRKPKSSEA